MIRIFIFLCACFLIIPFCLYAQFVPGGPTAANPIITVGIKNTVSLNNTGTFSQNGGSTFNGGNVGISTGDLTLGMGRLSVAGKSLLQDDVAIGHKNPNVILDVRNGTFAVSGQAGVVGGFGPTRFIWIPSQEAFGAGTDIDWGSIGLNSVAIGNGVNATGDNALAFGLNNTEAKGDGAWARGDNAVAEGVRSTAMGMDVLAKGDGSTALGFKTLAYGTYSHASGSRTSAGSALFC